MDTRKRTWELCLFSVDIVIGTSVVYLSFACCLCSGVLCLSVRLLVLSWLSVGSGISVVWTVTIVTIPIMYSYITLLYITYR